MYKWTGKGVLRHGKLVVHTGEIIPDVVSAETIESLVKKGAAEKMSGSGKTDIGKAEAALEKAEAAVEKAQAALDTAPDDKKEAVAKTLEKKEAAAAKACEAYDALLEGGD